MFYEQLIKICNERNVKPTPLVKSLGLSPGNIKKWQDGAKVNSDTIMKFANYFNVPADYFFIDFDPDADIDLDEYINDKPMTKVYNIIGSNPDHIVSMLGGKMPSAADLKRIADYLGYTPEYFLRDESLHERVRDFKAEDTRLGGIPPRDLVINIMNKLSHSPDFNFLQVRISKIIISNLARKNYHKEQLDVTGLSRKKLDKLYDSNLSEDDIIGFNFSDLERISETFNLSYDYLFTGRE